MRRRVERGGPRASSRRRPQRLPASRGRARNTRQISARRQMCAAIYTNAGVGKPVLPHDGMKLHSPIVRDSCLASTEKGRRGRKLAHRAFVVCCNAAETRAACSVVEQVGSTITGHVEAVNETSASSRLALRRLRLGLDGGGRLNERGQPGRSCAL